MNKTNVPSPGAESLGSCLSGDSTPLKCKKFHQHRAQFQQVVLALEFEREKDQVTPISSQPRTRQIELLKKNRYLQSVMAHRRRRLTTTMAMLPAPRAPTIDSGTSTPLTPTIDSGTSTPTVGSGTSTPRASIFVSGTSTPRASTSTPRASTFGSGTSTPRALTFGSGTSTLSPMELDFDNEEPLLEAITDDSSFEESRNDSFSMDDSMESSSVQSDEQVHSKRKINSSAWRIPRKKVLKIDDSSSNFQLIAAMFPSVTTASV